AVEQLHRLLVGLAQKVGHAHADLEQLGAVGELGLAAREGLGCGGDQRQGQADGRDRPKPSTAERGPVHSGTRRRMLPTEMSKVPMLVSSLSPKSALSPIGATSRPASRRTVRSARLPVKVNTPAEKNR